MPVTALVLCYNESQFIRASITSYIRYVDRVIVLDGAFKGFPSASLHSDDGTLEQVRGLARKYGKIELRLAEERLTLAQARNRLFSLVGQDVAFILDADELVCGDLAWGLRAFLDSEAKMGYVRINEPNNVWEPYPKEQARLFRGIEGLHYQDGAWSDHYRILDAHGFSILETSKYPKILLAGFEIVNMVNFREPMRRALRDRYYELWQKNWIEGEKEPCHPTRLQPR